MSVREEDRQRNCPSRGFGIAAAAIGVGVGAALYYFFNKRGENPDAEGSTSNWICEEPHALRDMSYTSEDSSSSMDISTDSDTNTEDSSNSTDRSHSSSDSEQSDSESDTSIHSMSDFETNLTSNADTSYFTISENSTTDTSMNITESPRIDNAVMTSPSAFEASESDSSFEQILLQYQPDNPIRNLFIHLSSAILNRRETEPRSQTAEIQRLAIARLREQAFRERSWTLEECSICFESMQRNQEVMALPCTHRFHQPCILPWLQERQTCPICRKDA